jgi:hypothetical protein
LLHPVQHVVAVVGDGGAPAHDPAALAGTGLSPEALTTLLVALMNGFAIEEIIAPGTVPPDLLGAVLESVINRRH